MSKKIYEKRWAFVVNATYFAIIFLLVFLFLKYAFAWMMPFIVGFVLAMATRPVVSRLCKKFRINHKLCAFIVTLLEFLLIAFIFGAILAKIVSSARAVFSDLPAYFDSTLVPIWNNTQATLKDVTSNISPEVLAQVSSFTDGFFENLRGLFSDASNRFLSGLAWATGRIPSLFLNIIFTILATFFISMDYKKIKDFTKKHLPHKTVDVITAAKQQLGKTLLNYIKAYGIIMTITFVELLVGLLILRVDNALGIAAIVAVLDILPVLGTGAVVVPWSIIAFASGNYFLAVGLLIIYVIVIVVRNFAEPKIVGMQLGLHPLVTLIALFAGYKAMGIVGMILFPVTVTIILALRKSGKLKIRALFYGHHPEEQSTEEEQNTEEQIEAN